MYSPKMFQPKKLDKMSYQQLYKIQSKILRELSTYDESENWTHYGPSSNTKTHAHLKRKKCCNLCNRNFYKTVSLIKHMKGHHNVALTKKPKGLKNEYFFNCAMCEHPFLNFNDITEHPKLCKKVNCQAV